MGMSNDPTHLRKPIEDRLDQHTRDALDAIESLADGNWEDDSLGAILSLAYEKIVRLAGFAHVVEAEIHNGHHDGNHGEGCGLCRIAEAI